MANPIDAIVNWWHSLPESEHGLDSMGVPPPVPADQLGPSEDWPPLDYDG